jgi:hypothetical protein
MRAVSIHLGCAIWSAFRSDSSECPKRIGVGDADKRDKTWFCTSVNVAVASDKAAGVIPDHLMCPVRSGSHGARNSNLPS